MQQCLSNISAPQSPEGQRALKGAAYLVAAMKLYHGPPSLSANPMKGGIKATADKLGVQVGLNTFSNLMYASLAWYGSTWKGTWRMTPA